MIFTPLQPRRRPRAAAFTLLELIVALGMVAVIGISLATAMSIAFRARGTAHRQVEAAREAAIAIDLIERELASALPPAPAAMGEAGLRSVSGPFLGAAGGTADAPADSFEFFALGRDWTSGPAEGTGGGSTFTGAGMALQDHDPLAEGARWVQIAFRPGDISGMSGGALVRRVERNLLTSTVQADVPEEVLLTNVRSFGVRYYDGAAWQEEWDSASYGDSLPLALEITLELAAPSLADPERPYRVTHIVALPCARPDLISASFEGASGG